MKIIRSFGVLLLVGAIHWSCGGNTNGNGNDNTSENENSVNTNDNVAIPEPDGFENVQSVQFTEANFIFISETIEDENELHVYDIGSLSVGDRISVQCVPSGSNDLDPMAALFDESGYRLFWADDVNPTESNFIAAFSGNIRHNSLRNYVVVSSSIFPTTTGKYELTIQKFPDVDAPILEGQTFVLQWGAVDDVSVAGLDYGDLPAFDAANINAVFADDTSTIQEAILSIVREDFEGYDVTILTSDDTTLPLHFSTIYFDPAAYGELFSRVDEVDFYNGNDTDNAIVFLGAFDGLTSNTAAMSQAIGNIVSREIGRLLGLMLTDDVTSVMDRAERSDPLVNSLLDDRSLGISALQEFAIGEQNAPQLLEETVGLQ